MAEKIICVKAYTLWPKKDTITNTSFSIVKCTPSEPIMGPDGTTLESFIAKGNCLPGTGEFEFALTGHWSHDKGKSGEKRWAFNVEEVNEKLPTTKDGTVKFLTSLNGVGKTIATRMYDAFGGDIFNIIENSPSSLETIKGIKKATIGKIQMSYAKRSAARKLFQYLYGFNVKDSQINKIYKKYKEKALDVVKLEPYSLVEMGGIGFFTADKIAKGGDLPMNSTARTRAGILEVLLENEVGGVLCSPKTKNPHFFCGLRESLSSYMEGDGLKKEFLTSGNTLINWDVLYLQLLRLLKTYISEKVVISVACNMHKEKSIFISKKNINGKDIVNVYRYYTASSEYRIAKRLMTLNKRAPVVQARLNETITLSQESLGVKLSVEQEHAVKAALSNATTIITGGPGTGKTSVQKVMLDSYKGMYPDKKVLLMAPTGMAASRMMESTGFPASTIHQALQLRPTEDSEMPTGTDVVLDADLIIIDEASMIDSHLMGLLINSIMPGTQVVIVGDVDQLPSIGCGCVLRELINSKILPTIRLTKVFRQASGSNIAINAARIKTGESSLVYDTDFEFNSCSGEEEIIAEVEELYPALVQKYGLENVTVLTAGRKINKQFPSRTVVNALNPFLRDLISKHSKNEKHLEIKGVKFYKGDKVMFTKNDAGLVNGDVGFIEEVKDDALVVNFGTTKNPRTTLLSGDSLELLVLSYATTVHKSQGSEYNVVLMVIDERQKFLLTRELLYTGITRAKKMMYLVGSDNAFGVGIANENTSKRKSQLAQILKVKSEVSSEKKQAV